MSTIHLVIAIFMDFPKGIEMYSKGLFTILKTHFIVGPQILIFFTLDILCMRPHQTVKQQQLTECFNLPSTSKKPFTDYEWSIRCSWRVIEKRKEGEKLTVTNQEKGKAKVWKLSIEKRSFTFWMMGLFSTSRTSVIKLLSFPHLLAIICEQTNKNSP